MNFVTGATGLLGTRLLFDLLEKGFNVRAGKRENSNLDTVKSVFKYYGDSDLYLFNQIEWVDLDLLDVTEIADAMMGVDTVYHCAAVVSFHHSDYELMYQTNVVGTRNMVNIALELGVRKFVHVSSTAAIGKTKEEFQKESNPWKDDENNSYYSLTKHGSEQEVWRGIEEGLNAVILNPCIILGPSDWNKSSTSLFKTIKKGLKFYTSGANAYVDVRDVSKIMITLVERDIKEERFLCIGENMKFIDLFKLVAESFKVKPPSILAKAWQANLIWRIEELKYRLIKSKPVITKETARSSQQVTKYSNQKVKDALDFEFRSVKDAVKFTSQYFIQANL